MDDIDAAFDDAYRTDRIEAGDDPSTLPNPYSRPSLTELASKGHASTSSDAAVGGGFIADDADFGDGGFMLGEAGDYAAGGRGFMVNDAPGGFFPKDDDPPQSCASGQVTRPNTIPLCAIPEALANLGLDSADPSILSLFAETAYVPASASRRRLAPGVKLEKVVGRQEFQQVASILVEELRSSSKKRSKGNTADQNGEELGAGGLKRPKRKAAVQSRQKAAEIIDEEDGGGGGGFMVDDADNSEDDFEASKQGRRRNNAALNSGSDLTSDDEEFDVNAWLRDSTTRRRRGGSRPSPSPSPSLNDEDTDGHTPKRQRRTRKDPSSPNTRSTTHLNPLQRSSASTLFELLLDRLPPSTFPASQRRIGPTELAKIIASIGEKIPSKEIEDMIEEGAKLFTAASPDKEGQTGERKSTQAIKGAAAAQGITSGSSVGLDEFAGILVHNRLI